MEDRKLQERRSSRRRKRIKRKKKNYFFRRLLLALIAIALLYLIIRLGVYAAGALLSDKQNESKENADKLTQETGVNQDNLSLSLDEEEAPKDKGPAVNTKVTPEMKKKDLDKRLTQLIKEKKLENKDFSLGYFNLNTDESYAFNEEAEFNVGHANNFILAMNIYDLAEEKHLNLDEEVQIESEGEQEKLNNNPTVRELIKILIESNSQEARDILTSYIEGKSSKNWYDDISKRYGVDLSYNNQMTSRDAMKILRRLFGERRMTAEERINAQEGQETVLVYQELINFMSSKIITNNVIRELSLKGMVSENYGEEYDQGALMGFVLDDQKYIYVIMSSKLEGNMLYESLWQLDQWHSYYNK